MVKGIKRKSALIFAALLLVLAAAPGGAYGAPGIETEKTWTKADMGNRISC